MRLEIQLMRRDLYSMIPLLDLETAAEAQLYWTEITKSLRRKLTGEDLLRLHQDHQALLSRLKADVLDSSDVEIEQHKHDSNINNYESEKVCIEAETVADKPATELPLDVVMKACPQLEDFYGMPIRHWSQLVDASSRLHKAIGISESGYRDAVKSLGIEQASIVIAALLQRFEKIRSPGAYLRSLVQKAAKGQFTYRPMIMALLSA